MKNQSKYHGHPVYTRFNLFSNCTSLRCALACFFFRLCSSTLVFLSILFLHCFKSTSLSSSSPFSTHIPDCFQPPRLSVASSKLFLHVYPTFFSSSPSPPARLRIILIHIHPFQFLRYFPFVYRALSPFHPLSPVKVYPLFPSSFLSQLSYPLPLPSPFYYFLHHIKPREFPSISRTHSFESSSMTNLSCFSSRLRSPGVSQRFQRSPPRFSARRFPPPGISAAHLRFRFPRAAAPHPLEATQVHERKKRVSRCHRGFQRPTAPTGQEGSPGNERCREMVLGSVSLSSFAQPFVSIEV